MVLVALFASTRPLGGWVVLLRVLRVLVSLSWFGSPGVKVALVFVPFRVPDGGAVRVDAPPLGGESLSLWVLRLLVKVALGIL